MAKVFFDRKNDWETLFSSFDAVEGELAVFVGVLRSSGVYRSGGGVSVAKIAAINEFGSSDGRVPERSFMRAAIDENSKKIEKLIETLTQKIITGEMTATTALGVVGQFVRDRMVSKINSGIPPENSPATIAMKGSSKTLIDTGQLKGSIEWEVKAGKRK